MLLQDPIAPWTLSLKAERIPVLQATREAIQAWHKVADRASANSLADTILRDPLMTLRVLVHVSERLGARLKTPVETVTAGLVLIGMEPFFRDFADVQTVETRLSHNPPALSGVLQAIARSHRAARLAAAFAIHRQDDDAEVLHQAALLDNFAGLLLWCEAPHQALEIAQRQRLDPNLRSVDVQREVLGTSLSELEQSLMAQWMLPEFLRHLTDPRHADQPGPRGVMLAVRIARHSALGWHNPALPDDFRALGHLLSLTPAAAEALVREVES